MCIRDSIDPGHWSRDYDVPLDTDTRHCISVPDPSSDISGNIPLILMTQRCDNQTFIIIKEDLRPQVKLYNMLSCVLMFREEGSQRYDTLSENTSIYVTMPWLTKGFPYIEQNKDSRKLQFSLENNGWSAGVDMTGRGERVNCMFSVGPNNSTYYNKPG